MKILKLLLIHLIVFIIICIGLSFISEAYNSTGNIWKWIVCALVAQIVIVPAWVVYLSFFKDLFDI